MRIELPELPYPVDDTYSSLWYPVLIALMTVVIGTFFVPETYKRDIFKGVT